MNCSVFNSMIYSHLRIFTAAGTIVAETVLDTSIPAGIGFIYEL
jgi:hypothetical protein